MSSVNPVSDRTDEPNDSLLDEKRKGQPQASKQRRVAGRLLQTLRTQTPLTPTAQRMQEVANKSSQQASAIKSEIQSANSRFKERSEETDDALRSFAQDLAGTRVQTPDLTASFAKLCLSQKPVQPKEPPRINTKANIEHFMATEERGAAFIKGVGTVLKWTAKTALGCDSSPAKELKACRSTLELAKTAGEAALDLVGLKEPVQKLVRIANTPLQIYAQALEGRLSIPKPLSSNFGVMEMGQGETSGPSRNYFSLRLHNILEKMGTGLLGDFAPAIEKRKHALILTTSTDHKGAFSQPSALETLDEINHLFKATHVKVSDVSSFCHAIDKETAEKGPIDVLFIRAHGLQNRIALGKGNIVVGDPLPVNSCLKNLPNHATIVLDTCLSGNGRKSEPNIANHLATQTHEETRIISPEGTQTFLMIKWADPVEVSYFDNFEHVPTYLIDKEVRKELLSESDRRTSSPIDHRPHFHELM